MIFLSIIIPVRNEENFIGDTLKSMVSQDYPKDRYELLVVDGHSTDRTCNIVKQIMDENPETNIRLLENPGKLSSRARNIGANAAKGQLIGVIDGHVHIPDNQLFLNMERLYKQNNALCLSRPAPLDVPGLNNGNAFWIAIARKCWLGHSTRSFIYSDFEGFVDPMSAGFAYDRSIFEKVGYFDESFDAAEDVEFHYRIKKAGVQSYTAPSLLIYSYPRESLRALLRQQIRYGNGRARLIKKHPEAFTKESLAPIGIFFLTISSPAALILAPATPIPGFAPLSLLVFYLLILCATGLYEAFKRNHLIRGLYVAMAIWTTHFGLGYGFITETIRGFINAKK